MALGAIVRYAAQTRPRPGTGGIEARIEPAGDGTFYGATDGSAVRTHLAAGRRVTDRIAGPLMDEPLSDALAKVVDRSLGRSSAGCRSHRHF